MIFPKFSTLVGASAAAALLLATTPASAYESACIYPKAMPDPMEAQYILVNYATLHPWSLETPMAIHHGLISAMCGVSCMAMHDATVLNPVTGQRPLLVAPPENHNAYSIALCNTACHAPAVGYDWMKPLLDRWNLPITSQFHPELAFLEQWAEDKYEATTGDLLKVAQVVVEHDFDPIMMGQLAIAEIYQFYMKDDGWNNFGDYSYDFLSQSVVNCTHNCMPYSDLYGYYPRNHPGRPYNESEKYNVTGDDMYWQPLLEDDGYGYFSRQQHVVPHLATTAKMNLDPNMKEKTVPAPEYEYYAEAQQVVEELRLTAESKERRAKIEVFDNKLLVRGLFEFATRNQFKDQHSYQKHLLYVLGISYGDDDGVILAWKEKLQHDLVRPTTVIQKWGDDKIVTYGGDRDAMEAVEIPARSFEAYIRVMPHSEYPSGSSCLCTIYREYADAFTLQNYGAKIENSLIFGGENGHETNCNGDIGEDLPKGFCNEDYTFTLKDMTELEEICGQSRLWGGMHFSKSVPAGHELCAGLGSLGLEKLNNITAGSDFGGNEYFVGDERPMCSDPAMDMTGDIEPPEVVVSKDSNPTSAAGSMAASGGAAVSMILAFIGYMF